MREYAVDQLMHADDIELNNYLPQLVQTLRFETGKYPFYLSEYVLLYFISLYHIIYYIYIYIYVNALHSNDR